MADPSTDKYLNLMGFGFGLKFNQKKGKSWVLSFLFFGLKEHLRALWRV
jgi:hypothetical protein